MDIKNCSACGVQPRIQSDEFGITYRFICDKCQKHTDDKVCPSSSIIDSIPDGETYNWLVSQWNSLN